MVNLTITGFGEEYTTKKYRYRGSKKVNFTEAANLFVNGLLICLTTGGRLYTDSVSNRLQDGTLFNSIELRLVSYLPTPSEATPGLYKIKDIDSTATSDFNVRITRSNTKLLIETTGFDGYVTADDDFSEKLKVHLGVK